MAFVKPQINTIANDIKNVSIYLRSVKKWGKSTLFRDVLLAKYNDLSRGVLVECGLETGDTMLNANMTHLDTYKDFMEFKKWLIETKGKEHNIELVCFDTADEMMPVFEREVIRLSNIENPQKPVKTIKQAFSGYNAGIEMAASMVKKYIAEIKQAGFGVWVIAHSKFKTIREKGGLEEDGYMQLTSNLVAAYESAFGDIFDCTLTGVIDRVFDEKKDGQKTKKYTTDSIRKLYFRGTTLIDAGGRFASNTVPEYLEYDMPSLDFAKLFIKTIEDGLAGSAIDVPKPEPIAASKTLTIPTPAQKEEEPPFESEEVFAADDFEDITAEEAEPEVDKTALMTEIRGLFKDADKDKKAQVKEVLKRNGVAKLDESLSVSELNTIKALLNS